MASGFKLLEKQLPGRPVERIKYEVLYHHTMMCTRTSWSFYRSVMQDPLKKSSVDESSFDLLLEAIPESQSSFAR